MAKIELGNEIINSINERSKINAIMFNIKQEVKSFENYNRLYKNEELPDCYQNINIGKKLISHVDTCVPMLVELEPLCKKYSDLFWSKYESIKKSVHTIARKQPLLPI